MTAIPVVLCRYCDGLTFTLDECSCRRGGDRLLVEDDRTHAGEPWSACALCQGLGTVARPCHSCGQTGRRRAQLVLTMTNLDTGVVASANVVPGVVEPNPWPGGRGWHLPLAPLVRELAATVGAGSWRDVPASGLGTDGPVIFLPRQWKPSLPESSRRALEAEAIAAQSHAPWCLLLGRTAVDPPRDLAADLGRWCRLADLLCLDLVVEARRRSHGDALCWDIRYEVPGSPVTADPRGWADDLPGAVAAGTVADALYGIEERGRAAPAHYLAGRDRPPPDDPRIDLDQIERRIVADCTDLASGAATAGAQAVWRDGRWWHTSLRVAGSTETFVEQSTGQIVCRQAVALRRGWQPPAPSWQGPAIPYVECGDCDPHSRLRACDCTLGGRPADPDCRGCAGAGRSPSALPCRTCQGTRRLHLGVNVTVTDLENRVVHLTWRPGPAVPAPQVATQPGGRPVHRLPGTYRLGDWADTFGVRPEDLAELDGAGPLGHDLRYGIVTLPHSGADALNRYLMQAGRGRPGARLLVGATRPDVPPLAGLVRLLLGLRLAVTVTVTDHSRNATDPHLVQGDRWDVTAGPPGLPVDPAAPPTGQTPEDAIAACLDHLGSAVLRSVPDDPAEPIRVPQTPRPTAVDDPVPVLRRLARHHPGQPVAAYYEGVTCQLHLRERGGVRHLATAPTLPAALADLGLQPG